MAIPSKMHDCCNAIALHSISSIPVVIQAFVVFLLISFVGLLLQQQRVDFSESALQVAPIDGVLLSFNSEKYNHTKQVIAQLDIPIVRKVPPSFQSAEVDHGMESFFGSREFHNNANLKAWSNRMAWVDAMEAFVAESNTTSSFSTKRWRLFFEDDLAMHPSVNTSEHAKALLAKFLDVAKEDGFVLLGMCGEKGGPICKNPQVLDGQVEMARCAGPCSHAFGFQPRAAARFLNLMSEMKVTRPRHKRMYFDQYMLAYETYVKKAWVLGSNLKSPTDGDHIGLFYQDRLLFPLSYKIDAP